MAANSRTSRYPGRSRRKRGVIKAAMRQAHGPKKGSTHEEWSLNDRAEAKSKVVAETREEGFVVRRVDLCRGRRVRLQSGAARPGPREEDSVAVISDAPNIGRCRTYSNASGGMSAMHQTQAGKHYCPKRKRLRTGESGAAGCAVDAARPAAGLREGTPAAVDPSNGNSR